MARTLSAWDLSAMTLALAALRRGEPVAISTETVYGLAADATNPNAIAAIYEAKGRPRFNPLISHVSDLAMAKAHVAFSPLAEQLALAFWPGPLTLVLPVKPDGQIHELARAGLETAAVRMPQGHARELIGAFGKPLAAPSANRSGRVSPTTAEHVADDLGDRIGLIVDGGACRVGLESTIVAVDGDRLRLLRPGGIGVDEIETRCGITVERPADGVPDTVTAPGMLASHYAPDAAVRLDVAETKPGDAVLRFGGKALPGEDRAALVLDLSPSGDLHEAAANLFSMLKQADASGARNIAVARVPMTGLGEAINDRLRRAAAPR